MSYWVFFPWINEEVFSGIYLFSFTYLGTYDLLSNRISSLGFIPFVHCHALP